MSLTLERNAWDCSLHPDDARPGQPLAIGDILPEVLEMLFAAPRTDARAEVVRAEVIRAESPRARTGPALRLVG